MRGLLLNLFIGRPEEPPRIGRSVSDVQVACFAITRGRIVSHADRAVSIRSERLGAGRRCEEWWIRKGDSQTDRCTRRCIGDPHRRGFARGMDRYVQFTRFDLYLMDSNGHILQHAARCKLAPIFLPQEVNPHARYE